MGKIIKFVIAVIFAFSVFIIPAASVELSPLSKIPVNSCNGSGELFVYKNGDPFKAINTEFIIPAGRDQLLIFKWLDATITKLEVNNVNKLGDLNLAASVNHVGVYSLDVNPGDIIEFDGVHALNARSVQGFLAQDSSNPVYDTSSLNFVFDNAETNSMFLTPGMYSYLFFDKYSINLPGQGDDNRKLNVKVNPGGIVDETFIHPRPSNVEGVVVGNFNILTSGNYDLSLDTEDSIYWLLFECQEKTFCGDGTVQQPNDEKKGGPLDDGFESCDDGNEIGDDQCTNVCTLTGCVCRTFCGDNITQNPNSLGQNEECDDGNALNGDGCSETCEKELNCRPLYVPITLFSPDSPTKNMTFLAAGSDSSSKVLIPRNLNVTIARVNITGKPVNVTIGPDLDIVVVNDVSGSMDDNCGADGAAQPGETPCKINDLKNATKNFINIMLGNVDNRIGLASYATKLVNSLGLTSNPGSLQTFVNNYKALGMTCISCGLNKGIDIANSGSNPKRVIVLMSDGIANRCIAGSCTTTQAKNQAVSEAAKAFNDFGLEVHTIGFGADADQVNLQNIAAAGHGTYRYAETNNLTEAFMALAVEITGNQFPENPSLDVGANGLLEFAFVGPYSQDTKVLFTSETANLISSCTCPGCTILADQCLVDFKVTSGSAGTLKLHSLLIDGCLLPD